MKVNLKEMMKEYARLPFSLGPVRYMSTSPGHSVAGYRTYLSAFIIPVQGKVRLKMGESSYEPQIGKVIHGCPGKWLTTENKGSLPFKFFIFYYHYDGADTDYMHCPYELEIGFTPRLFATLQKLSELWYAPDAPVTLEMKALSYSILTEMFVSAQSMGQIDAQGVVADAKSYIERYYMQPHTLCELGSKYNMSGKYFSDVFKRYAGISPIDYLIACRLEQSKKLLESTECSVKEIGRSVGYEDALYFSRQFSRHFGLSPSRYRQSAAPKA